MCGLVVTGELMKKNLNLYLVMSLPLLSAATVECSVSSTYRSTKELVADRAAQLQSSVKKAANSSITFIAGHKAALLSSVVVTIVVASVVNTLRDNDAFRWRIGLEKKAHRPTSIYINPFGPKFSTS
jgi:hypothetical protein